MNGFVKSPWTWDKVFETCAKWYYTGMEKLDKNIERNMEEKVNELYALASTEQDIYMNAEMVATYSKIMKDVSDYEEEMGEIVA